MNEGEVVAGGLVVARGHRATALEPVEELDVVALSVQAPGAGRA